MMKSESVQLNDIEMYYETEGSGEPLLLLHGGTGCNENWAYAGRNNSSANICSSSRTLAVTEGQPTLKERLPIDSALWMPLHS